MITICFTGHRPDKLGGYNWNTTQNKKIIEALKNQIIKTMDEANDNMFTFVCGGALGIDQMAFSIVEDLRNTSAKAIFIELASPFKEQDCKWNQSDRDRFQKQIKLADTVTYVDLLDKYKVDIYLPDIYYPAKMELRNHYMVDKSDIVISVYDGSKKGGTHNCVEYAKRMGKKIIIINPKEV